MRAKMDGNAYWWGPSQLVLHSYLKPDERLRWERAKLGMICLLLILPIFLSCIALFTNWDLALADAAFDAHSHTFPLRHVWLTEVFNHVILKDLFTVMAICFIAIVVWDMVQPRPWSWLRRFQFRVVACSAVVVPTLTSLLKHMSKSHCPWDLTRYGGTQLYVRLFDHLPTGMGAGQCMPAGHASSALWIVSLSIFFMPHRLIHAAGAMMVLLAIGFGVGWLQQLRGAHFLTHTLWSLWIALALVFLIMTVLDRIPTRQPVSSMLQP